MGLGEGQILKREQARLNPLITFILGTEHGKGDGLGPGQKLFQVGNRRKGVESHDGLHPSIMPETQPRVQTHFMVETRPPFRLISYWKRLPIFHLS